MYAYAIAHSQPCNDEDGDNNIDDNSDNDEYCDKEEGDDEYIDE